MSGRRPLALLANPENRRAAFFLDAAARCGLPAPTVLAWRDLLDGAPLPDAEALRIDSPGEDFGVWRRLVERGGGPAGLTVDPGRIRHSAAWYRGLLTALRPLRAFGGLLLNDPDEIEVLFDKRLCHARLVAAGVPVAPALPAPRSWSELPSLLEAHPRLFLKPAHGSSASGVLALSRSPGGISAWTSVERDPEGRLYNNLRVRQVRDAAELAAIVDALVPEGLHAEVWIPKAQQGGHSVDLRVLCVAGRPRHAVVRRSPTPLTNLHLGNARGDLPALRAAMGEDAWSRAMAACAAAAACFPRSLAVGVDLLVESDLERARVIEVNAFGDLLPGLLHEGEDPQEAQVRALLAGWRSGGRPS
ncbi:MAG: STM4014 family protein [Alphaproteobacteria bacterium]|nr:STM4014 family protein [Alphaproteobacteria bacterium]